MALRTPQKVTPKHLYHPPVAGCSKGHKIHPKMDSFFFFKSCSCFFKFFFLISLVIISSWCHKRGGIDANCYRCQTSSFMSMLPTVAYLHTITSSGAHTSFNTHFFFSFIQTGLNIMTQLDAEGLVFSVMRTAGCLWGTLVGVSVISMCSFIWKTQPRDCRVTPIPKGFNMNWSAHVRHMQP